MPITPKRDYQRFTHGMGVGDVNGDGRWTCWRRTVGGSSRRPIRKPNSGRFTR